MKTTVKQLAVVTFAALLLSFVNVKAEGTEAKASSVESIDTTLQLEKWMTEETIWSWDFNFANETENEMELENWMTNDKTWNTTEVNTDSKLAVEPWMINENYWK